MSSSEPEAATASASAASTENNKINETILTSFVEQDVTEEGQTAVELESSMQQKLSQAVHLSRAEGRHSEAADILGDLIKLA